MAESNPIPPSIQLSVIIPAYNDWEALEDCLRSLKEQITPPGFEVIIVDDGSREPAPESIHQWRQHYALTIIRQSHAGIPSARNQGIRQARGEVLLFTDADCRFRSGTLSELFTALARSPDHDCFQLHIVGDGSNLVGRAETLRLIAIQEKTLQSDGRICYLNTAGFAIRRSRLIGASLFDPAARRAEDTLLLANLIKSNQLPWFVRNAIVQHSITLSFWACLRKDVRTGISEGTTSRLIHRTGVRVRMRNRDRLRMLASTWKRAADPSIGRRAWAVLVTRQLIERAITTLYRFWR